MTKAPPSADLAAAVLPDYSPSLGARLRAVNRASGPRRPARRLAHQRSDRAGPAAPRAGIMAAVTVVAAKPLDDDDGWLRVGGRRIDFVTTLSELQDLLNGALRADEGPWALTGVDLVRTDVLRYRRQLFVCPTIDLATCDKSAAQHRLNVWAWSGALTRSLPRSSDRYETLCSFNGFIGVQRSGDWSGGGGEAALMVVDRVRHVSGDERHHAEYRRVFERLRRAVRKRLVAETHRRGKDGNDYVDGTLRWTAAAVEAHETGADFGISPVSP